MVETEFWKQTLEVFSKLIDKPKMSDKLLKKPPPRYVFDIIVNTMKATNFNQGLYSDNELDSKFFEAVR
jgi:TRAF3-interacting protein 1